MNQENVQNAAEAIIDPGLKEEIFKLESTVKQYQTESKYIEAIGVLEELLKIKKINFGTNSKPFTKSCK